MPKLAVKTRNVFRLPVPGEHAPPKVDRRTKKSQTYKELRRLAKSQDRYFEVLAACAEMRDEDGSFPLTEEVVEELAKWCQMKAWEIEYCIRKHDGTFGEIEAPSFLEEERLRSFAQPRPPGKVFLRNDHRGSLAMHLHLALKEKGV